MTAIDAVIATNRFGLGARPDELPTARADPRAWLKLQIQGARPLTAAIQALTPSDQVFQQQAEAVKQRRAAREAMAKNSDVSKDAQPETVDSVRSVIREHYYAQVLARYQQATHTSESFRERLVYFWSNHFAVSIDKVAVAALAGTMENEAIRPHLHGSFYDLLLAAESHPAMILYLDNQRSTGPNSELAQRAQRRKQQAIDQQRKLDVDNKIDINENLAREILELHTLGVSGGYTQTDVTTFAKILTGWSVGGGPGKILGSGEPGKFVFREALHEPGAQTLLGKRFHESGIEQPIAVLKMLAKHPATAKFIATKLVRHFIADEPPAAAIEHVAKAFRNSEGDLPTVHAAVVDCAEAWAQPLSKFKTPQEFAVSTFRSFDFLPEQPRLVIAPFELMGQRPWSPGSPAGWADIAGQWDGPDALMKRIEWATAVAQRVGSRYEPLQLAERSLGDVLSEHTHLALRGAADAAQGVVLWLMSPEFQRR